jgi:hypothetical protein
MEVFRDKNLNSKLRRDGYVVISLLDNSGIEELRDLFHSSPPKHQLEFTTFKTDDTEHKTLVDARIKDVIHNKFSAFISDKFYPFWGNFMVKPVHGETDLPLHSDWQYVDETKHISLNVWVPLDNTNQENGALHVVPKSHLIVDFPRGVGLPRYYEKHESIIKEKFGKRLDLKKGSAVIYDHRLLHYSYPNNSDANRLAASLVYLPEGMNPIHYFTDEKTGKSWKYLLNNVEDLLQSKFYEAPLTYFNKEQVEFPSYESINLLPKFSRPTFISRFKELFNA